MHVFFSGIGGTGIGPLALLAHQAGFTVSGSDKQDSQYIRYLQKQGITNIAIGQTLEGIAHVHNQQSIDWFVYTSALPLENPHSPELLFCENHHIKTSKRDEFINFVLNEKSLKLIAIAGTHGKTTTTAMTIWLLKQLGLPISYSVGAKITFGDMGHYEAGSTYFVYEADEFDRNFLAFHPYLSIITGVDWDHPDTYPSRESYQTAFSEFLEQSTRAVLWQADVQRLGITPGEGQHVLDESESAINDKLILPGLVNRQDAWEVAQAIQLLTERPLEVLLDHLNHFPGVSRRFEQIIPGLYSDYAHTPPKIRGALQLAHEIGGQRVVVVYEGLHNTRQHFIRDQLRHLFDDVEKLYIVPSYLAREDKQLPIMTPTDLKQLLAVNTQARTEVAEIDDALAQHIRGHLQAGDLVLCLTAGGGNSLDEWLRHEFQPSKPSA